MVNKKSIIYVAGHRGLVGSSILRKLKEKNYTNIIVKTKKELDLTNKNKVYNFLKKEKPEFCVLPAIAPNKASWLRPYSEIASEFEICGVHA